MSEPAESTFLALQTAVAGRFSLERELGRGGMGIVYLAHDVLLERPVAIKLLAPTLGASAEMRRRFVREARIAAQCFHPHIVPIHAVEESGQLAFFVMAYVQGETLAERLHRVGPLHRDMVRGIARDIGWALSYAHERGVIHRDVKPENILIEDGTERALITDFGIALRDDPSRSQSGEVAGTARFMAPEQALGENVDGRADLYALGVTLYLAATGHHPFEGRSTIAVIAQGDAGTVPTVWIALHGLDRDSARVCGRRDPRATVPSDSYGIAGVAPCCRGARTRSRVATSTRCPHLGGDARAPRRGHVRQRPCATRRRVGTRSRSFASCDNHSCTRIHSS